MLTSTSDISTLEQQAKQMLLSKRFDEAETIYLQILKQNPDNYTALFALSAIYLALQNFKKSLFYSNKAIELNPKHLEMLIIRGHIFLSIGKWQDAADNYIKSIECANNYSQIFNEITKYCNANNLHNQTIATLNHIITILPASKTHGAYTHIGQIYQQQGNIQETSKAFSLATKHENYSALSVYNYTNILSLTDNYNEMKKFFTELSSHNVNDSILFTASVAFLRMAYSREKIEQCTILKKQISKLQNLSDLPGVPIQTTIIYWKYISRLIEIYHNRKILNHDCQNVLYIIGDSHCLSSVGCIVNIDGTQYKCERKLLVGAQARYFAKDDNNIFKQLMYDYMGKIPKQSTVMLMFGEIDCIQNGGIYAYLQKTNQLNETRIQETIDEIIDGYINYCVQIAATYEHQLIFYGTPAFYTPENNLPEPCYIIKEHLNKTLKNKALKKELKFIDVYSLTSNQTSETFLDELHVTPQIFEEACKNKL